MTAPSPIAAVVDIPSIFAWVWITFSAARLAAVSLASDFAVTEVPLVCASTETMPAISMVTLPLIWESFSILALASAQCAVPAIRLTSAPPLLPSSVEALPSFILDTTDTSPVEEIVPSPSMYALWDISKLDSARLTPTLTPLMDTSLPSTSALAKLLLPSTRISISPETMIPLPRIPPDAEVVEEATALLT